METQKLPDFKDMADDYQAKLHMIIHLLGQWRYLSEEKEILLALIAEIRVRLIYPLDEIEVEYTRVNAVHSEHTLRYFHRHVFGRLLALQHRLDKVEAKIMECNGARIHGRIKNSIIVMPVVYELSNDMKRAREIIVPEKISLEAITEWVVDLNIDVKLAISRSTSNRGVQHMDVMKLKQD